MNETSTKTAKTTKNSLKGFVVRLGAAVTVAGLSVVTALNPFAAPAAHAQIAPTAPKTQTLYATSQWGTLPIDNQLGTALPGFDNQVASMSGEFGQRPGLNAWTFSSVQPTTLSQITSATLEVRFAQSGWRDDTMWIEYTTNDWAFTRRLATFSRNSPPPAGVQTFSFTGLEGTMRTQDLVNNVQLRIRVGDKGTINETWTLKVDQVRLVVRGY